MFVKTMLWISMEAEGKMVSIKALQVIPNWTHLIVPSFKQNEIIYNTNKYSSKFILYYLFIVNIQGFFLILIK